jgi:caffeoyl-CoA O-methyltransferase
MTAIRQQVDLTPELHRYVVSHSAPLGPVAEELVTATARLFPESAAMQIPPEQAGLLSMLVRILGARNAIELGTYTGYSALAIARGLAPGGRLLCCDVSEEWTAIARAHWAKADVADRIDLRVAPAIDTLRSLPPDPAVDFVFMDADKRSYTQYWAELVPRMRPGGIIAVDNVLRHGRVASPDDPRAAVMREFNDLVVADDRVEVVMLPLSDGLTLAQRK